jgi:flavin reductase (DIM6/NTAB) family NADH-FMN oxidoreductase RutF
MKIFDSSDIKSWDRFYRANFINSLSGFKSASLIGTINAKGNFNLGLFSNIVHLGADPALIGFVNRPREAAPHTLANIEATLHYTINAIPSNYTLQAHQTSAKYDIDVNEFYEVGLNAEITKFCIAPFVHESPVKYALRLVEIIPIKHNNTFFVIGEITHAIIDETIIEADGFIDLQKADIITSLGIDSYYTTNKLVKLPYAKP